jgi:hypothetical protein
MRSYHTNTPAPALEIAIPLESAPRWRICAESYENERRLRLWLAGSHTLSNLGFWLGQLQAELEEEAA